jgi:hypothetical protein
MDKDSASHVPSIVRSMHHLLLLVLATTTNSINTHTHTHL